jgi:hypothetical protein
MIETSPKTQNGTQQETKNRMVLFQERFDALEAEARGRLVRALGAADEALHELDDALARVSREDWSMSGMRRRFEDLRVRAESFRATALKRVAEMPGTAVTRLASGSRAPVQSLAREIDRLAKRLETVGNGKADGSPPAGAATGKPARKPTTA